MKGLRHASDPDHLAGVTTLAAGREPRVRQSSKLGLARAFLPHRTCLSMALLSAGFGRILGGAGALRAAPLLGVTSLAFRRVVRARRRRGGLASGAWRSSPRLAMRCTSSRRARSPSG
jgi:hypothetical protein